MTLLVILVGTLSTFLAESCLVGLLGGCFEQRELTLAILVLPPLVGVDNWHSEHILG